jgi:diadenosine tetraphosphatase ApaH/serine/threonine PP2A family protein phosphatase
MEWLDTVASYSVEAARRLRREYENAGPRLLTERVRLPYEIFFDLLPVEHLQFFQSLQLYHLAPEVLCAHGGVDPTGDLAVDPEVFLWGSDDFPQEYCGRLPVVYGHWNNGVRDERGWPRPCVKANKTYGIDTIAHGVLTAVRFPDLQIFQSRRFPSAVRGG